MKKVNNSKEKLIKYMQSHQGTDISRNTIIEQTKISKSRLSELIKELRKDGYSISTPNRSGIVRLDSSNTIQKDISAKHVRQWILLFVLSQTDRTVERRKVNMGYGVVSDLLNSVSKMESGMDNMLETTMIPRNQIEKNPLNCQSVNGIEELAQDIKMAGLEQPLVVYQKEDGNYRLLTGERRLTAIDLLIERGELPPSQECYLPCIIKDLDEYKLPLDDELKEKYAIRRTNRFNRNPTDADIMRDYQDWKEIISALKAQGYSEFIVGQDETGKDIVQSLKGRTREIARKTMGTQVSTGQLAKYDTVEKNAVPEVIEAINQERLTIAVAEKVSGLAPEKQAEFIQSTANEGKITKQNYDDFVKKSDTKDQVSEKKTDNGSATEEFDVDFICQVRDEYKKRIKLSEQQMDLQEIQKNKVIIAALDLYVKHIDSKH